LKKVVLVGFGDIAQSEHLLALQKSNSFALAGVIEVNPNKIEVATKLRIPVYNNLEEAKGHGITCAIITTPPHVTPELSASAISLGFHVLIEKPIATTSKQLEKLTEMASKSSRVVQVGFVNRFSPFISLARSLIASGKLGTPLVINMGAFDEALDETNQSHIKKISEFLNHGSVFAHEGTHLLDYLAFFGFSERASIQVKGLTTDKRFSNPNYVTTTIEYVDGTIANLEVGWMFQYLPMGYIRIMGPSGRIEIIRRKGFMEVTLGEKSEVYELSQPWNSLTFPAQLNAFCEAIFRRESKM
jgi:predicted dehydrogenase